MDVTEDWGMKKKHVIPLRSIQSRPPLNTTLVWFLALDYVGAPGWAFGAAGTMLFLFWVMWIVSFWTEEALVLEGDTEEAPSKWVMRLKKLKDK